jgi:hypothetical protein
MANSLYGVQFFANNSSAGSQVTSNLNSRQKNPPAMSRLRVCLAGDRRVSGGPCMAGDPAH